MVKEHLAVIDEFSDLNHLYKKISEVGQDIADKILEIYCLYQIASTLSGKMDIMATIRVLEGLFQKTFQIDSFSIFLIDEGSQALKLSGAFGFSRKSLSAWELALNQEIFEDLLQSKKYFYLENTLNMGAHHKYYQSVLGLKGSLLCLPLFSEMEEPLGIINLFREKPYSFKDSEIHLFEKLSHQVAKVIEKILIYQHTKELSITDDLTKIFNRRYFNQRFDREMQRAIRYNRPLSVIMADIDHFKSLNDTYGHLYGDEVLKKVASILEVNLRKADILARFGGEEFVILLPEIAKSHSLPVAEKLRHAVENYGFEKGSPKNNNKITISLGLASFPEDALSGNDLLENADKALYRAKTEGRNRIEAYHKKNGSSKFYAAKYRLAAAGTNA